MSAGENVILHVILASSVYFSLSILGVTMFTTKPILGIDRIEGFQAKLLGIY